MTASASPTAASLQPGDFARYPPQARALAERQIEMLRPLPLIFVAMLLRQMVSYDWQFPAERTEFEAQLGLLRGLTRGSLAEEAQKFGAVTLPNDLVTFPWASEPERFAEKLTAYLWASHGIDAFRETATRYYAKVNAVWSADAPAMPRLCLVLMGQDAKSEGGRLFEKLRPKGTYFNRVDTANSLEGAQRILQRRAAAHSENYAHWQIAGGEAPPSKNIATVSYLGLAPIRRKLLELMQTARISGTDGPENLRSLMAQVRPEQLEGERAMDDPILQHFALSLLAEGSGTQIFSTTFVQWGAREALRRAQPLTLFLHYAARQAGQPMNEMISASAAEMRLDPQGSLVDADMGAYYTWLNLQRLSGAENSVFIVCHEGGHEALAIAPSMAGGTSSTQACSLEQILRWSL